MNQRLTHSVRQHEHSDRSRVAPPGAAQPGANAADRRLRELADELAQVREAIKLEVARDIHDGLGAELTAARFALANVEQALNAGSDASAALAALAALALAQQSLDAASEATRKLVQDLHAPNVEGGVEGGVVAALSEWTREFAERTGLATSFVCAADVRLTQLPPDAALAIMRVAQEALNNVAKHAQASHADVRIQTDAKRLILIVEDNGRGLPPRARRAGAPSSAAARGFGLPGMRARCESFGGALRIASRLGDPSPAAPWPGVWPAADLPPAVRSGTTVRAHFLWAAMVHDRADLSRRRPPHEPRRTRHTGKVSG
jgi:two-component system, NarL family, sensor histidine kinase UhpB